MNQNKVELLEKAREALKVPALVNFVKSLLILAPENMPGLAKVLRDIAGIGQPWEKSIIDLARLARSFPQDFLAAIQEEEMKKIIRRMALKPEYIKDGYTTTVIIAGFECALRIKPIGLGEDIYNDLLGKKIETKKNDCYTFLPYFDIEILPPPITKEELLTIIQSFGRYSFPNNRRFKINIDGHELLICHDFHKNEQLPYDFYNWVTGGWNKSGFGWKEKYDWEKELNNFYFIFRATISFPESMQTGPSGMQENWKIPEYFKSKDFRLKIILNCLREYFGLTVEV